MGSIFSPPSVSVPAPPPPPPLPPAAYPPSMANSAAKGAGGMVKSAAAAANGLGAGGTIATSARGDLTAPPTTQANLLGGG